MTKERDELWRNWAQEAFYWAHATSAVVVRSRARRKRAKVTRRPLDSVSSSDSAMKLVHLSVCVCLSDLWCLTEIDTEKIVNVHIIQLLLNSYNFTYLHYAVAVIMQNSSNVGLLNLIFFCILHLAFFYSSRTWPGTTTRQRQWRIVQIGATSTIKKEVLHKDMSSNSSIDTGIVSKNDEAWH